MRIGTTPTHQFILPFDADSISAIEITYCQNRQVILQKYKKDCTIEGNTVSVTLSQEETFHFRGDTKVEIQIRVVTDDGKVCSSDVIYVNCGRCLSSEVL